MPWNKVDVAIVKALKGRIDIVLDNSVIAEDGTPEIRGVQLRRAQETEIRGKDSYHPFTYIGWKYYGQAFAIETNFSRVFAKPLSKSQLAWKQKFEFVGGLYIEAKNVEDALLELGQDIPQPWSDYEHRVTRVK